ncbi:antitermination protein [Escherichia coli]|uniref:bacteriophage antitermination protein Q n=1 Tax=Escherichia coli TaxID=562 RepID=UPI000B7F3732|nr:bacteriophage antitermination protein Q [Escherichia coli]EAC1376986.1 antitermination protein [Escherichia coli]EEY4012839.1 antitermination protein [Escherichia coli]EFD5475567.1 antitermination protein [Escherichia coli]EFI3648366.1 antitermination protein [Escherichia coli]EFM0094969.1 antitermination protein [Escherichia coli]
MSNEYLLEYTRIKLRAALQDLSGGSKGQLEALCEHPPADKNAYPRKHIHRVQLEDRTVDALVTPVYALESFSRRRPAPPMNDFEFADSSWRRSVNSLDVSKQAWLRYCYGGDLAFKHQTAICEAVWRLYKHRIQAGTRQKVVTRLISLVWLAVQEVAAGHKREDYREIAGVALASLLTVSRSTWCETYASHWQGMKDVASILDEAALLAALNYYQSNLDDVCV